MGPRLASTDVLVEVTHLTGLATFHVPVGYATRPCCGGGLTANAIALGPSGSNPSHLLRIEILH